LTRNGFFKRWYEGCKNLTPSQLAVAQRNGQIGMILGTIFAGAIVIYYGMWYFIFVFGFGIFLQLIGLISTIKNIDNLKKFEEEAKNGF
jgi:hypothetical protein